MPASWKMSAHHGCRPQQWVQRVSTCLVQSERDNVNCNKIQSSIDWIAPVFFTVFQNNGGLSSVGSRIVSQNISHRWAYIFAYSLFIAVRHYILILGTWLCFISFALPTMRRLGYWRSQSRINICRQKFRNPKQEHVFFNPQEERQHAFFAGGTSRVHSR